MNIKLSIADIIISFHFEDHIFLHCLKKDFKDFIIETPEEDMHIDLFKVNQYELIDHRWDYFFVTQENGVHSIKKWDLNGSIKNNQGQFFLHEDFTDLYHLLKFILITTLPNFHGLMLHASTTANETEAIIATGVSGSGKSTFAKKLQKEASKLPEREQFHILHDEITLIRKKGKVFLAYPSPFQYNPKHIVNYASPKPVKYLFFVKKKAQHSASLSQLAYHKEILKVIFSYETNTLNNYEQYLSLMDSLYQSIHINYLHYSLEESLLKKIKEFHDRILT